MSVTVATRGALLLTAASASALLFLARPIDTAKAAISYQWDRSAEVSFSGEGCGTTDTARVAIGRNARNVSFSGISVGDRLDDAYEEEPVATISEIRPGTDAKGRSWLYVTVAASDSACTDSEYQDPLEWETDDIRFKVRYESLEKVWFNEFFTEGDEDLTRQRPKWIKCGTDCGWAKLRWRSWGGRTARASGVFRYVEKTISYYRTINYPVRVTFSNPTACYGRLRYLRMTTYFVSTLPPMHKSRYSHKRLTCARGIF